MTIKIPILLTIFLSITILNGYAQNLVPNPSFELYDTCPYNASQIYFASPWKGITTNSTDYFNSCNTGVRSVPACGGGWQFAKTGNAYAAIYGMNGYGSNYREYLQVKLDSALKADSCYFVEYYCNEYNLSGCAINTMGAYLSNTAISAIGPGLVLHYVPQIISQTFLTDTINWIGISGYYHAVGGEQFITIGNFNSDINTDTLYVGGPYHNVAYYLIDDVSITKVTGCDTIGTGINEYENNLSFKLYPNPNNGSMTLEYVIKPTDVAWIKLFDITGKEMDSYAINANTDKLQSNNNKLNNGIYFYQIIVNNKTVKQDKLIIIK